MKKTSGYLGRLAALGVALSLSVGGALALSAAARADDVTAAPGNNATLKIHEQGTPSGTEDNDPKVCVFNVEGFGFDAGQTGYLRFSVQGGDGPHGTPAGPYSFGPTDDTGYYATQYFNLDPGHYKATLYGKQLPNGTLIDVKAKSKVFKVTCGPAPSPSPSPSTSPSESPSPSPSTSPSESPSPSPSVLPSGDTSPSPSPSVLPTSSTPPSSGPGVLSTRVARTPGTRPVVLGTRLAQTGARTTWLLLLGTSLLVGGSALMVASRRRRSA